MRRSMWTTTSSQFRALLRSAVGEPLGFVRAGPGPTDLRAHAAV